MAFSINFTFHKLYVVTVIIIDFTWKIKDFFGWGGGVECPGGKYPRGRKTGGGGEPRSSNVCCKKYNKVIRCL